MVYVHLYFSTNNDISKRNEREVVIHIKNKIAFSIVELIFVIIIISILSAIAVPKFQAVSEEAYISKASSELSSVRASLFTERQKRILRGDTMNITTLGNIFTTFSAAADGSTPIILQYPPKPCTDSRAKGCWINNEESYIYRFPDTGEAKFKLKNNRLVCDNDDTDCKKLEN